MTMDAILATIVAGRQAQIWLNLNVDKNINFDINLLILTKPFNSSLGKYMHKAARPSGTWNHQIHAAGEASGSINMVVMFVVCLCCVMRSHLLYVKKYQSITLRDAYYLTIRLKGVTFCPTLAFTIPGGIMPGG